ncbi:MAG: hydrolase 1, exosortase A system-associated, partial [Burkholderiales bacterium]|nr:hydrolase 1, exosortase A system-associated [Burkholderiales bacterium]
MNWREEAFTFDCAGEALCAVLSRPERPLATGVVIVVGGPQYRAGSHRQFVHLARALAAAGHAVLRFDVRGMGDSGGLARGFEDQGEDIASAIAALRARVPELEGVVLWGLCDGASAALLYAGAQQQPQASGLVLLNPWVRSPETLARTQVKHYYLQRLRQPEFWKKALSGRVAWKAAADLGSNLRTGLRSRRGGEGSSPSYQQRMAAAWSRFQGRILLILSEDDYVAREFSDLSAADAAWRAARQRKPGECVQLAGADHTCSTPGAERAAQEAT